VLLVEGRIAFRPVAGASEVLGVSLPRIGNESLGFDGSRLVVPRSLLSLDLFERDYIGTLGHELEFSLNVAGTVITTTVLRAEHDSIQDLLADIETRAQAALEAAVPGTTVDLAARLTNGDRIEFSATDGSQPVQVVLTEVRDPSVLVDGRLSLGVATATFPTAQVLAEQLEAIINLLLPDTAGTQLEVDFDTVSGEISLRVDLARTFDLLDIAFDFGVDLGDFITIDAASALGLTASVNLGFEFGVDLSPDRELVVAPPVSMWWVILFIPHCWQVAKISSMLSTKFGQKKKIQILLFCMVTDVWAKAVSCAIWIKSPNLRTSSFMPIWMATPALSNLRPIFF
jgi:hypothetical protein